jgi:glucose/arabinose dehydrogenase
VLCCERGSYGWLEREALAVGGGWQLTDLTMRDLLTPIVMICAIAALSPGCGSEESPPSNDLPPQQTPPPVVGKQLGWDQPAPSAEEFGQYSFVLYADGVPSSLGSVTCGSLRDSDLNAPCSAPLPPLSVGSHTLELVTRITRDGKVLESARSAPLVVTITSASSSGLVSQNVRGGASQGPAADPYAIVRVAGGLDMPSGLARLPDGRLLVAERGGRIRLVESGVVNESPAVVLPNMDSVGAERVDLALARNYAATGHVYVSYVAETEGGPVGRVVRFREVRGTLGEPATIVDGLPAQTGPPRMRIAPDATLYLGIGAASADDADNLGSYGGKILRFTRDGGVPVGSTLHSSPVFSAGHRGQLGFDWEPANRELWHAETDGRGVAVGRPVNGRRGPVILRLEGVQAVDVVFHWGATPATWRGSLFVAAPNHECVYRVSGLSSSPPEPVVEQLFVGRFGRIVGLLSAEDGLYLATANGRSSADGRPADAIFRIRDREPRNEPASRRGQ